MNALKLLSQANVQAFIATYIDEDVTKLILNPPSEHKDHIKVIADQLLSRQKAKHKLRDWAENFQLIMPPPLSIEQASSQATSTYKQQLVGGEHLVDLTGGMGVDCLALSEKFQRTTYVEKEKILSEIFQHNASIMDKKISIINQKAVDYLHSIKQNKNITFFIDPARRDDAKNRVFKLEDCEPNLLDLLPLMKEKGSHALLKLSPMLDMNSMAASIADIKEIHVVSVRNDCKEVLVLLDFKENTHPSIHCVNLQTRETPYTFTIEEEKESNFQIGSLESYLYSPNNSVLKAGAFKKIAVDYGLKKLAKNTHLYTSDKIIQPFPGRIFKYESDASKETIHSFAPDRYINIITRNYPVSIAELKKKWKVKDGGKYFLIGYKDDRDKPQLKVFSGLARFS